MKGFAAAGTLVAAAAAALATTPHGAQQLDETVTLHGGVTISWDGDPARCAARGLCGTHGAVTIDFGSDADLQGTASSSSIQLDSPVAVARVRRVDPGSSGACVEYFNADALELSLHRGRSGRYAGVLDASQLSGERCAGPLTDELAALPLSARRLAGHKLAFDLSGTRTLHFGPYIGRVSSTLRLAAGAPDGSSTYSSSGETTVVSGPTTHRHILVEFAHADYHLSLSAGALRETFSGRPSPGCVTLDSCGVTGGLLLSFPGARGRTAVIGERQVGRRRDSRAALADLRAGRLGINTSGTSIRLPIHLAELLVRPGGAACNDTSRSDLQLDVTPAELRHRATAFEVTVQQGDDEAPDALRTHCPGPTGTDLVGESNPFGDINADLPLLEGTISNRQLGARRITVRLSRSGAFSSPGYTGRRNGSLTLTLTRRSLLAGTRREVDDG